MYAITIMIIGSQDDNITLSDCHSNDIEVKP